MSVPGVQGPLSLRAGIATSADALIIASARVGQQQCIRDRE